MQILVDKNKCTGCGTCKEDCPKGQKIWVINDKAKATNLRYCHVCTICASKCPEQAITIVRDVNDEENINGEETNIGN